MGERVKHPLHYYGFEPGSYTSICINCNAHFEGDKRAWRCVPCAEAEKRRDLVPPVPRYEHRRAPITDQQEEGDGA